MASQICCAIAYCCLVSCSFRLDHACGCVMLFFWLVAVSYFLEAKWQLFFAFISQSQFEKLKWRATKIKMAHCVFKIAWINSRQLTEKKQNKHPWGRIGGFLVSLCGWWRALVVWDFETRSNRHGLSISYWHTLCVSCYICVRVLVTMLWRTT